MNLWTNTPKVASLPSDIVSIAYIEKNLLNLQKKGVEICFPPDCLTDNNFIYTRQVTSIFQNFDIPVEIKTEMVRPEIMLQVGSEKKEIVCWKFQFTDCFLNADYIITMKLLHEAGYKIEVIFLSLDNLINIYGFFCATYMYCDLFVFTPQSYPSKHVGLFIESILKVSTTSTSIYFIPELLERANILAADLPQQCVDKNFYVWA